MATNQKIDIYVVTINEENGPPLLLAINSKTKIEPTNAYIMYLTTALTNRYFQLEPTFHIYSNAKFK